MITVAAIREALEREEAALVLGARHPRGPASWLQYEQALRALLREAPPTGLPAVGPDGPVRLRLIPASIHDGREQQVELRRLRAHKNVAVEVVTLITLILQITAGLVRDP